MAEQKESQTSVTTVAMLTGATGGIGKSIARQLLASVDVLLLCARDEAKLAAMQQELVALSADTHIDCFSLDVSQPQAVESTVQTIFQRYKRLDIVINAAGVLEESALMMTKPEQLQDIFSVNTFGSFYTAQYTSRLMMRQGGGVILNIGSVVGCQGAKGQAAYSASKAALGGLTKSLARELAPYNIRVNMISPGFIETTLVAHYDQEAREQLTKRTALGRLGTPEDVSSLATFLCGDGASYITGQTLSVDGMLML